MTVMVGSKVAAMAGLAKSAGVAYREPPSADRKVGVAERKSAVTERKSAVTERPVTGEARRRAAARRRQAVLRLLRRRRRFPRHSSRLLRQLPRRGTRRARGA
jgi:hypothetical protein